MPFISRKELDVLNEKIDFVNEKIDFILKSQNIIFETITSMLTCSKESVNVFEGIIGNNKTLSGCIHDFADILKSNDLVKHSDIKEIQIVNGAFKFGVLVKKREGQKIMHEYVGQSMTLENAIELAEFLSKEFTAPITHCYDKEDTEKER